MNEERVERRKLRVLVISMGGKRDEHMRKLFLDALSDDFEEPVFSPGIPSRSLRQRASFFRICNQAGLLPEKEWLAIEEACRNPLYGQHPNQFFECLEGIPVEPGRHGSAQDVQLHYSVELWRKARSVNRGRAVLGCTLAHLIALKTFTDGDFDVLLEDNVRAPINGACAQRIRQCAHASTSLNDVYQGSKKCHMRYLGWLGSIPNLEWIYGSHIPKTAFRIPDEKNAWGDGTPAIFPFPTTQDIMKDLEDKEQKQDTDPCEELDCKVSNGKRKPGGTPIWGSYAYWMSKEAYGAVLDALRKDVGALMWKTNRSRYYSVKPVDKILPRQIMNRFGQDSVQLSSHPAFYRAPMLTSKIHAKWDPEFCRSTGYQLENAGLSWDDLWLTDDEIAIVSHYVQHQMWLTQHQLEEYLKKE